MWRFSMIRVAVLVLSTHHSSEAFVASSRKCYSHHTSIRSPGALRYGRSVTAWAEANNGDSMNLDRDSSIDQLNLSSKSKGNSTLEPSNFLPLRAGRAVQRVLRDAVGRVKAAPTEHLMIPVTAAIVGYITNWLAVQMIFYPIHFCGLNLWRPSLSPLGAFGWQGIVPTKAEVMSGRIVEMVTTELIDVSAVFRRLSPAKIAELMSPQVDAMALSIAAETMPHPLNGALAALKLKVAALSSIKFFGSGTSAAAVAATSAGATASAAAGAAATASTSAQAASVVGAKDLVAAAGAKVSAAASSFVAQHSALALQPDANAVVKLRDIQRATLEGITRDMQRNLPAVLDIRALVVDELCRDKRVLVNLFQAVGHAELKYLCNSGLWFGAMLGLIQMVQYALYPAKWTIPFGGLLVGLATNWIALKEIFEPIVPTPFMPSVFGNTFMRHGRFMMRQLEVSRDFADYMTSKVLTAENLWKGVFEGPNAEAFKSLVFHRLRQATAAASEVAGIPLECISVDAVCASVYAKLPEAVVTATGAYMDAQLGLGTLMRERMAAMSPSAYEAVLHPIFQEDELALIIAGGALGLLAGYFQLFFSEWRDKRQAARRDRDEGSQTRQRLDFRFITAPLLDIDLRY